MSHAHTNLLVHAVFSTKDRRPLIPPEQATRLYAYMAGVARGEFGEAIRIGGRPDHIHALLRIGADLSMGQVMSKFKSLSSGWAHKTIPELRDMFWQSGYGAFSVSKSNVNAVANYVEG
jgi:REP element-mobilizing transposase RayT